MLAAYTRQSRAKFRIIEFRRCVDRLIVMLFLLHSEDYSTFE